MNIDLTECGNFVVTIHANTIYLDCPDKGHLYYNNSIGLEEWSEYNKNNKKIHFKNSNGVEGWYEYNEYGNKIHSREIYDCWYDDAECLISKKEFDNISSTL